MARTRMQQLLSSLRESIVDKPPYISGTLQLPESHFSLFYKVAKDSHDARHINFASATLGEVEQLTDCCEPASFGKKQEEVLDENYRKAGKLDSECFSPMLDLSHTDLMKIIRGYLLEGKESKEGIKTELYKLNVYGKGSFFKSHVDTPRSNNMFGSLVIVFPTPHEGGALLLRHRGQEWAFDSGKELAAKDKPSIGYVAFFSDIEHEVAPVISGHRVTLTYNLYFDDGGPVFANDAVSMRLTPPQLANEGTFYEAFTALLENPEFLAEGGTLAFGLRHVYPIQKNLKHIYSVLKGSDAVVYRSVRALGFEPALYVYYEWDSPPLGVLVDKVIEFDNVEMENEYDDLVDYALREGGIVTYSPGLEYGGYEGESRFKTPELLEWVTPMTTFNRQEDAYPSYGNQPELTWVYGHICLIVRIGNVGDRLAYRTVAELGRENQKRLYNERGW